MKLLTTQKNQRSIFEINIVATMQQWQYPSISLHWTIKHEHIFIRIYLIDKLEQKSVKFEVKIWEMPNAHKKNLFCSVDSSLYYYDAPKKQVSKNMV